MYSFPNLKSVCCSMSSSNCCFLTFICVSQEAGQVVWYYHLFLKFPQFIVIHTAKGFGIVNKAEIDVFLELSCFFDDPEDVSNYISGSSAFSKTSLNIRKFMVHVLLKPGLENSMNWGLEGWNNLIKGSRCHPGADGMRSGINTGLSFLMPPGILAVGIILEIHFGVYESALRG